MKLGQKLSSYTFYGGNVVCVPVLFFFFFHCHSFSKKLPSYTFYGGNVVSLALALPLLSASQVERKNRLCCCYLIICKSPGCYAIYNRNARVPEIRKFYSGLHEGVC